VTTPTGFEVDHLVYALRDFERGLEVAAERFGLAPVIGGRHPRFGTRNALLALGPSIYLEFIAADPDVATPADGRPFGLDELRRDRLVTWAVRCRDLDADRARLVAQGIPLGQVQTGERERADGTLLRWRLTDLYVLPLDGAFPFLMDWGASPHPAQSAPDAGQLLDLTLATRHCATLEELRPRFPTTVRYERNTTTRLRARIQTPNAIVELT